MPLFFFDLSDGQGIHRDEFGCEIEFEEARAQAQALLPDVLPGDLPDDESHTVICHVRDEQDRVVYRSEITRLPGEDPDIRREAAKIFDRPDLWLTSPNTHFGGLSPAETIQEGHEAAVRNLLRQIIYVGMS